MVYSRFICLGVLVVVCSLAGSAQPASWKLVDGKAKVERTISISGKSQQEIYKDVYRWLMEVFKNPEEILKARLEGEYLRGEGSFPECVKRGALSHGDLHYTFAVEIKNEEVSIEFFQAFLLFSYSHEGERPHPIENYLVEVSPKEPRKREENERVRASLNSFASEMLESFEKHVKVR